MGLFKKKVDNYNKYARLFPAKIQNRILLEAVSKISGPKLVDYLKQLNKDEARDFYNKYPDIKARLNNPLKNKIYPSMLKKAALLTPVFWFGLLPKHEQAKYFQCIKDNLPWNKREKTQEIKTKTELKSSGIKEVRFGVGNQKVVAGVPFRAFSQDNLSKLEQLGFEIRKISGTDFVDFTRVNDETGSIDSIEVDENAYILICASGKKAFMKGKGKEFKFKTENELIKFLDKEQKATSSYSYKGVITTASCKQEAIAIFACVEAMSEGMRRVISENISYDDEYKNEKHFSFFKFLKQPEPDIIRIGKDNQKIKDSVLSFYDLKEKLKKYITSRSRFDYLPTEFGSDGKGKVSVDEFKKFVNGLVKIFQDADFERNNRNTKNFNSKGMDAGDARKFKNFIHGIREMYSIVRDWVSDIKKYDNRQAKLDNGFVVGRNQKSKTSFFIDFTKLYGSYLDNYTDPERNNFHRVHIFNSKEDAISYFKKHKKTLNADRVIPYREAKERWGDGDSRQEKILEKKEKDKKEARKAYYEMNKEKNKELDAKYKEKKPGIYLVRFPSRIYAFDFPFRFELEADSINDAFEKGKQEALRRSPHCNYPGYEDSDACTFTKKYIKWLKEA